MNSNHFRHCPKHRKPLPCPHCVAPEVSPVAEPAPETVQLAPKIGRPKKYKDDNERKLAHKRSKQEPERQRMIRGIFKKVRALLSKPDFASSRYWKMVHADRQYMTRLREELNQLPYAEVLKYYERLVSRKRGIFDASGRLQGERSGEAPQSGGMSELEVILAAIVREENGGDSSVGHGADADEVSDDSSDSGGGGAAPRVVRDEFENLLERAAQVIAEKEWDGPRLYEYKRCESLNELTNHILSRYRKGENGQQIRAAFQSVLIGEGAPRMAQEVNRYHADVYFQIRELEKADKQKGAKARRITRKAREARHDAAFSSSPANPT